MSSKPFKLNIIRICLIYFMAFSATVKAQETELDQNEQNLSPFAKYMNASGMDLSKMISNFDQYFIRDLVSESKVQGSILKVIRNLQSCYEKNDNDNEQTLLVSKLDELILSSEKTQVFLPKTKFMSIAQGRVAGTNLAGQKIILNPNYPTSNNAEISEVFYLHEFLESYKFQDRKYQLSGLLWSASLVCEEYKKESTSQLKILQFLRSKDLISFILQSFNTIYYNLSASPKIGTIDFFNDMLQLADGGGITGTGGGGDPIVAYFVANLYLTQFKNSFLQKQKILPNQYLSPLHNLKIEGYPAIVWINKNKGSYQIADSRFANEYLAQINNLQNKLKNEITAFELLNMESFIFGEIEQNHTLILIDTEIFNWYFNSEEFIKNRTSFSNSFLNLILQGINSSTNCSVNTHNTFLYSFPG